MQKNHNVVSAGGVIILILVLFTAIVLKHGFITNTTGYKMVYVTIPLLLISIFLFRRKII